MMNKYNMFVEIFAIIVIATITPVAAQQAPSAPSNAPSAEIPMAPSSSSQGDQAQKFGAYSSQASKPTSKGKTKAPTQAEIMSNAQTLANSLQLSCNVSDAALVAEGPATVNGQATNTRTYEVACGSGMGYFLVSLDPGKPYGFSCFAADATRAADVAAGRTPSAVCKLTANADVKAMATAVLSRTGINCTVRGFRSVGVSTKTNTEYTEVVCNNGTGYMLGTPVPGTVGQLRVATCHGSAITCQLSDSGPSAAAAPAVTKQSLKDALVQHNVACDVSDMRVVGQESVMKRYVAEFQCRQQPKGLVAFIPLNGNTAKFEALDCAAAAKRSVTCTLTTAK